MTGKGETADCYESFILGEPSCKQTVSVRLTQKGKRAPTVDAFWMGRMDLGKLIGLHHLRMLRQDLFNLVKLQQR